MHTKRRYTDAYVVPNDHHLHIALNHQSYASNACSMFLTNSYIFIAVTSRSDARIRVLGMSNLFIESVIESDEGVYTCTWSDHVTKTFNSATVNISVQGMGTLFPL